MQRARAIYTFEGAVSTDLPIKEGEIVTIINKLPGNLWWEGESEDGRIGTFPYNYVEELPPLSEFAEFAGKKGISNLDVIQFGDGDHFSLDDNTSYRFLFFCYPSFLVHIIVGDGEYIAEIYHKDFVNLNNEIKTHFPRLQVPHLPDQSSTRDIYRCGIHDYFAVCLCFRYYLVFCCSSDGHSCRFKVAKIYSESLKLFSCQTLRFVSPLALTGAYGVIQPISSRMTQFL